MSRLLPWFSTKNGKLFTRSCVGIAMASAFSFQIAIHGPCMEKYRAILQMYRHGKDKPLSTKVQALVQDVVEECNLSEEEKKKLKFFNMTGYDVYHIGGTNSPWGAAVGVPFTFEETKDIDFVKLRMIGNDSIDWIIDGQELMEALIISDKAKKFALMREIYSCNFSPILENSIIAAVCIFLPAELIRKVNMKPSDFIKKSFFKRSAFYVVCYVCGFLVYKSFCDPLKHLEDQKCDALAAKTGPNYLEGGIEYYTKTQERNKAIRQLLGPRGKRLYDEKGNEEYYLFPPRLPVSKHLDNLKKMKEDQEKTNASTQE